MGTHIKVRRRYTSGNIKDPELHEQRVINIEKTREVIMTIAMVIVGVIVFAAVVICLAIAS